MKSGDKIVVRQQRSVSGRLPAERKTLNALGLGRIGKAKKHTLNDAIIGMLRRVEHLIEVKRA